MEDSEEFKWAQKVVIKRQMRNLMEQLQETGEEVAVLTVNLTDNTCTHFGSPNGEWFISEQKNLTTHFLNFCKVKSKNAVGKSASSTPQMSPLKELNSSLFRSPPFRSKAVSKPSIAAPVAVDDAESGTTTMRVTIPRHLALGATDQELAGLVGRLVASQMAGDEKKGGDSCTKFEELVNAVNLMKKTDGSKPGIKRTSTPASGPVSKRARQEEVTPAKSKSTPDSGRSTRSGRKVSARFLEGVNSLKKAVRGEKQQTDDTISDEGTNEEEEEEEDLQDEKAIMNQISNMEPGAIKRVQVSTSDGKNVDVQSTSLTNLESLESIVAPIIQELDATGSGKSLCDEKQIKIVVCTEDDGDDDKVKIEMETSTKKMPPIKSEDVEESEDEEAALKEELDNYYGIEDSEYTDPDYDPSSQNTSIVETRSTPRGARQASLNSRRSITPMGLIRKIKKRASTETMPVQCESCGITVTGKSNLKSHFRRVHLQIRDHKCAICGKGFWSNNARESHMLSVHTRRCEACQEYVVESVPWGKGIDMKTNRDVICTCGAIVSIYSTFGRRRVYLRDDEPDDDGNIRQSRNKSNSGTKYACGTCGKLFMKKSNCERHSRAHTDAKDCVCYICGNSYTYESSLKKHLHNEHGIVKFACSLCGGNYSNEVALKVHMVKAHQSMTVGEHVAVVQQDKGAKVEDMDPDDEEGELRELEELDEEDDEGEDIPEGEGVAIQVGTAEVEAENQVHVQVENHIQAQNHGQVQVDNQMQVSEVVLGEAGHVQIASTGQRLPTTQEQIIQQVIQEGGGMSIIIKQVSVDQGLS